MFELALVLQIFVLINPLSSFPVLLAAYERKMNVRNIAVSAVLIAFAVALSMVFIGPFLFSLFGITLDSFRIAGGVVLFLLGIETVRAKESHEKKDVGEIDSLISVIATPLITGPATISFIAIKSYELGQLPLAFNLVLAFILVAVVFILFSLMLPKVNPKLVNISSRVLGLFLTAVAIQMIARGLTGMMAQNV